MSLCTPTTREMRVITAIRVSIFSPLLLCSRTKSFSAKVCAQVTPLPSPKPLCPNGMMKVLHET